MIILHSSLMLATAVAVFGAGEVTFLSKPPNVEFRGHEECDSGIVKDICSTCLGFTTYQTGEWSGLYVNSPFNFAECVVAVAFEGLASIGLTEGHKFPFITDSPLGDIRSYLEAKIEEHYPMGVNQSLVEIDLEDGVKAAELNLNKGKLRVKTPKVSYLKEEEDEVKNFLNQVALMEAISNQIKDKGVPVDGLPDLYWINLKALHPIVDIYGENSNTAIEAKNLVSSYLQQMKEVFDQVYQNKTLFLVLTSDSAHTRRYKRQAASELGADMNLATVYDENYPVFFNIFLWFTIAFIMTIIAASMVTACMDPGRDSIIYRMTSTRMKKDN